MKGKKNLIILITLAGLLVTAIIVLLIFLSPVYYCDRHSENLKNALDEANLPCQNDNDCRLTIYYMCNAYCIHRDVNVSDIYSSKNLVLPSGCPIAMCMSPEDQGYECKCIEGKCTAVKNSN